MILWKNRLFFRIDIICGKPPFRNKGVSRALPRKLVWGKLWKHFKSVFGKWMLWYVKNLLFREERICRNGNKENYCLKKEKFKVPQVGFLGKGHGKNLLFPRKEGFSHKSPLFIKKFAIFVLAFRRCILYNNK